MGGTRVAARLRPGRAAARSGPALPVGCVSSNATSEVSPRPFLRGDSTCYGSAGGHGDVAPAPGTPSTGSTREDAGRLGGDVVAQRRVLARRGSLGSPQAMVEHGLTDN